MTTLKLGGGMKTIPIEKRVSDEDTAPSATDKVEVCQTTDACFRVTLIHMNGEREDYGDFAKIDDALDTVRTLLESIEEHVAT